SPFLSQGRLEVQALLAASSVAGNRPHRSGPSVRPCRWHRTSFPAPRRRGRKRAPAASPHARRTVPRQKRRDRRPRGRLTGIAMAGESPFLLRFHLREPLLQTFQLISKPLNLLPKLLGGSVLVALLLLPQGCLSVRYHL